MLIYVQLSFEFRCSAMPLEKKISESDFRSFISNLAPLTFGSMSVSDKGILKKILIQKLSLLSFMSESLKKDLEFARFTVTLGRKNGLALYYFDDSIKCNSFFIKGVLKQFPFAYLYIAKALKADKEVVRIAVMSNAYLFRYIPQCLKNDKEVACAALHSAPVVFKQLSGHLRNDTDCCLIAVSQIGKLLEFSCSEAKTDSVVRAAVTQDGDALCYAGSTFKNNQEIILLAAQTSHRALHFAGEALKSNPEFILRAYFLYYLCNPINNFSLNLLHDARYAARQLMANRFFQVIRQCQSILAKETPIERPVDEVIVAFVSFYAQNLNGRSAVSGRIMGPFFPLGDFLTAGELGSLAQVNKATYQRFSQVTSASVLQRAKRNRQSDCSSPNPAKLKRLSLCL